MSVYPDLNPSFTRFGKIYLISFGGTGEFLISYIYMEYIIYIPYIYYIIYVIFSFVDFGGLQDRGAK